LIDSDPHTVRIVEDASTCGGNATARAITLNDAPQPYRFGVAATFDSRGERGFIFGGYYRSEGLEMQLGDVWMLELGTSTSAPRWSEVFVTSGNGPPPGAGGDATFIPSTQRLVIAKAFGIWALDGIGTASVRWERLFDRRSELVVYDDTRDALYSLTQDGVEVLEAASRARAGAVWRQLRISGVAPSISSSSRAAISGATRQIFLFGGAGRNDVWVLEGLGR
jgi:hypothetical protein